MPSFATTTEVRDGTDDVLLSLRARHILVAGSPSANTHTVKGRLPDDVDVVLESDLVLSLSGMHNRARIGSRDVQRSAIANHLLNYFHVNGQQLGLRPASSLYVDEADDIVKMTLNSTRPILTPRSGCAVRLSAIELFYVFRSRSRRDPPAECASGPNTDTTADPFTPHAFLPIVAALDRAVERFVVSHLVRRYPLVFGPWRERFDAEGAMCAKIARAVTDIIARSPHTTFHKKTGKLLQVLGATRAAAFARPRDTLSELLGGSTLPSTDATLPPESKGESRISSDTHDLLCHSMERLFKSGLKPIRYQSVLSFSEVGGDSSKNHDDGFTLSDYRSGTTPEDACCSDGETQHFALLSELDLDFSEDLGVDIRDHHELPIEDDAETLGGSQEFEHDLFYSDDEGSVEETDEDFWPSSESTIEDPDFDWTDYLLESSQTPSADAAQCNPAAHLETLSVFLGDDDDADDWPGDLANGQVHPDNLCQFSPAPTQESLILSGYMNTGQQSNSCRLETAPTDPDMLGFESNTRLLGLGEHGLEPTATSYLPVLLDDDLTYDMDGSRLPLSPFVVTAIRAPSLGGSSDAHARRSPDGDKLPPSVTLSPSSRLSGLANRGASQVGDWRLQCSPETACNPEMLWAIDERAHGQNEVGLVAGHASVIRLGVQDVVQECADDPTDVPWARMRGSDREGREGREEDAMLDVE